ncbi:uncharacterized protein SPSK_09574 [Sporothrix schenckii 1099-18]|uniref:FAD/NAD(P)-binding domain-containing protein n=2 Tax=Sporothrix schenckii TaxID=29908 RepID=U7PXW5_SPOS1|nr:uncharacterized protein SPSK_09574 [Sporothrix schenckii 1099-18]ERT00413.1 hypothetical protein HMPREF1624_03784 [Sporothrix schenckii ATCC 58251]KJR85106.1 hypothetical protein SPSK_09574 [Sporothrix schenckii 1099-18]
MSLLLTATPAGPTSASVLVVGAGPAGLAAALALARQQHTVLLFGDGVYRNGRARHQVPDHSRPSNFGEAARDHVLQDYGQYVSFREVTVVSVRRTDGPERFTVVDASGAAYHGRKLILASGVEDVPLPIDGYAACFGRVIVHCLLCNDYPQRTGASAGVLAVGAFGRAAVALHMARQARQLAAVVTIYTNGQDALAADMDAAARAAAGLRIDTRPIRRFVFRGDQDQAHGGGVRLEFADGSPPADEAFLAHAPATRPRGPFAQQLGLATVPPSTVDGDIQVALPHYETSVRGVFAAGDNCAAGMKTVAHAMLSGNVAGMGAASQLSML